MAVKSLLNSQVTAYLDKAIHSEMFASHLYQHLANQMQRIGYFGAQKFFLSESADELKHYRKHVDYYNDRGSVAPVPTVEEMSDTVKTLRDAVELAYETEKQLGDDYASWYSECKDVITCQFLLQFLEIQRKSIGEYGDLIAMLDLAKDDPSALMMVDKHMGG